MGNEGKHPSLFHLDQVESMGTTETAEDAAGLEAIRRSNNQHPDHDTTGWTPRARSEL
jgi:hypothetical protein